MSAPTSLVFPSLTVFRSFLFCSSLFSFWVGLTGFQTIQESMQFECGRLIIKIGHVLIICGDTYKNKLHYFVVYELSEFLLIKIVVCAERMTTQRLDQRFAKRKKYARWSFQTTSNQASLLHTISWRYTSKRRAATSPPCFWKHHKILWRNLFFCMVFLLLQSLLICVN